MKNLCRKGKGKVQVHPSPNAAACGDACSVLRLLPVAIAALSAALVAEDREVLAYFIARSLDVSPPPDKKTNKRGNAAPRKTAEEDGTPPPPPWGGASGGGGGVGASSSSFHRSPSYMRKAAPPQRSHPASFECTCFQCYTSFWSRWDASPRREIIHQAIDLFEEHVAAEAEAAKARKTRKGSKIFKDDNKPSNSNTKLVQEGREKEEVCGSVDEESKPAARSKQIVPVDFEEENEVEELEKVSTDNKGIEVEEVRAGACPLEGRSIMRRMFPDIMGFVADHLWTAWSSPVRATNA